MGSSCCCGGNSTGCCEETTSLSDCCSNDSYSCSDDAYAGDLKTVVVDFLYLDLTVCDRCMGADKRVEAALERCAPVLAACGYQLKLNSVDVQTPEIAETYRFESSPTIRVNGVDMCASIEENDCACCSDISDAAVTCRLFPFNNTYYEVPPTDMIVAHIMNTVLQNKSANPTATPYVMPQNLVNFFEGKERKNA